LLLYNKHISIANELLDSDFIIIDGHISGTNTINNFNKIKNKYLHFKHKTIICIYAPIDETISRSQYNYTDDKYSDLFCDNFIYFTILNVQSKPNIIFIPLGTIPSEMTNGQFIKDIDIADNIETHTKIYFKGSPTHIIRNIVYNCLSHKNDCNIVLNLNNQYFWNKLQSHNDQNHYQKHIQNCAKHHITLLIRGDREFCYSFCDYLFCGNVICFINANSYKYIGLEKFNLDKIFLFFENDDMNHVYNELKNILYETDKIYIYRNIVKNFYNKYIAIDFAFKKQYQYHGGCNGFVHFIVYKLQQILNNNYVLNDNKILDPHALSILNIYN
jgi:hypothetical protein